MPSYRFPVLLWEHFAGGYTACLVEDNDDVAAIAPTRSAALGQLKDLLHWRYREKPWLGRPDFVEPELHWVKVEVRPEYQVRDRMSPAKETIALRLPVVRGKDSAGLLQCAIPTLGIRFNYDDEKSLAGFATHYVQMSLKGLSPQQLARHLPPPAAELDDVVVVLPREVGQRKPSTQLEELAAISEPLGARASRTGISRPWQRDEQVSQLQRLLTQERASALLLGESGSGKTAVLMEAVRKAQKQPAPKAREAGKDVTAGDDEKPVEQNRFWLTSAARLISGMRYLGQWQQRCEKVILELATIEGVLCIENLLDLVRTGGVSPNDSIAAFLLPYLQRGELRIAAEATPPELDACRRLLPAFAAMFQIIAVPAFDPTQAVAALDQLAGTMRQNLRVEYERNVVNQIYRLFARFMPYQSFPGKAAAFTAELFDRAARIKVAAITNDFVLDRFVNLTGLPELFLRDDLPLRHADVCNEFRAAVIGQDRACESAANVIATFKAGLNDPGRPLAVLLFCGPTGVGKTQLAKTISEFLFGHGEKKDRLVRLDMSEYATPGASERLLGAPEGEPSDLIKRLRQQPFTVVLLDEIEKAAPEIFDVLLGVFDEGRLTDRYGRLTTFRSAIIIMTSNLGADRMEPFGLARQATGTYDGEAMSFFRPEFFNRIDSVVPFDPLGKEAIRQITLGELRRVAQREGLQRANIKLTWTERVVELLCREGFDDRYGARPLQRAIETRLVTPLAHFLVGGSGLKDTTLLVDTDATGVKFSLLSPLPPGVG
jgi:ATP-dependent Clp protease ATP-binding subunit ClpC